MNRCRACVTGNIRQFHEAAAASPPASSDPPARQPDDAAQELGSCCVHARLAGLTPSRVAPKPLRAWRGLSASQKLKSPTGTSHCTAAPTSTTTILSPPTPYNPLHAMSTIQDISPEKVDDCFRQLAELEKKFESVDVEIREWPSSPLSQLISPCRNPNIVLTYRSSRDHPQAAPSLRKAQ